MQHIILIGFKNAGKSTIGVALAKKLERPFVDLDEKIRELQAEQSGEKTLLSCRKIMEIHGEEHFRELEHEALENILTTERALVVAVGGGTPMMPANRELLQKHTIIQVSAPKSIVFERIMINGKPAFFSKDEEPIDSFQKLWGEREPVFNTLAAITVENTGSVDDAVEKILDRMEITPKK